jgi:hypothetical protein
MTLHKFSVLLATPLKATMVENMRYFAESLV